MNLMHDEKTKDKKNWWMEHKIYPNWSVTDNIERAENNRERQDWLKQLTTRKIKN